MSSDHQHSTTGVVGAEGDEDSHLDGKLRNLLGTQEPRNPAIVFSRSNRSYQNTDSRKHVLGHSAFCRHTHRICATFIGSTKHSSRCKVILKPKHPSGTVRQGNHVVVHFLTVTIRRHATLPPHAWKDHTVNTSIDVGPGYHFHQELFRLSYCDLSLDLDRTNTPFFRGNDTDSHDLRNHPKRQWFHLGKKKLPTPFVLQVSYRVLRKSLGPTQDKQNLNP